MFIYVPQYMNVLKTFGNKLKITGQINNEGMF